MRKTSKVTLCLVLGPGWWSAFSFGFPGSSVDGEPEFRFGRVGIPTTNPRNRADHFESENRALLAYNRHKKTNNICIPRSSWPFRIGSPTRRHGKSPHSSGVHRSSAWRRAVPPSWGPSSRWCSPFGTVGSGAGYEKIKAMKNENVTSILHWYQYIHSISIAHMARHEVLRLGNAPFRYFWKEPKFLVVWYARGVGDP